MQGGGRNESVSRFKQRSPMCKLCANTGLLSDGGNFAHPWCQPCRMEYSKRCRRNAVPSAWMHAELQSNGAESLQFLFFYKSLAWQNPTAELTECIGELESQSVLARSQLQVCLHLTRQAIRKHLMPRSDVYACAGAVE